MRYVLTCLQSLLQESEDVEYCRAAWKLLTGVLLGEDSYLVFGLSSLTDRPFRQRCHFFRPTD